MTPESGKRATETTPQELEIVKARRELRYGWISQIPTVVTVLLGIATYAFTWWHDSQQRADALQAEVRQSQRAYFEQRLKVFDETAQVARRCAWDTNPRDVARDTAKFERLEGQVMLYADFGVLVAINRFDLVVTKYRKSLVESKSKNYALVLQEEALIRELGRSIEKSWGLTNDEIVKENPTFIFVAKPSYHSVKVDFFALKDEGNDFCANGKILWEDFRTQSFKEAETNSGAYVCWPISPSGPIPSRTPMP